jgi:5'-nucleotidase
MSTCRKNLAGIRWTRQAVRQYDGEVVPGRDPMRRPIYWFTVRPLKAEEEGTDRWAFAQRYVSITPLRPDLTNEQDLARVLAQEQSARKTVRKSKERAKR